MNWLDSHKTKILGSITVLLGFIQGYPGLPQLLSEHMYAWTMFVVGALTVVCGFLNSNKENDDVPPSQE